MNRGVIESYKKYLPVSDQTPIITMGEGQTPLIKSTNIVKSFSCEKHRFNT